MSKFKRTTQILFLSSCLMMSSLIAKAEVDSKAISLGSSDQPIEIVLESSFARCAYRILALSEKSLHWSYGIIRLSFLNLSGDPMLRPLPGVGDPAQPNYQYGEQVRIPIPLSSRHMKEKQIALMTELVCYDILANEARFPEAPTPHEFRIRLSLQQGGAVLPEAEFQLRREDFSSALKPHHVDFKGYTFFMK